MRISDNEVKKILDKGPAIVEEISDLELELEAQRKADDRELARQVTQEVLAMPDREDMINELKAKIEAGTYNPSAEDIVDGMIRRAIADRVR
jgi:anti-sigma28 factor (negative regulator of flagellin synthesis)